MRLGLFIFITLIIYACAGKSNFIHYHPYLFIFLIIIAIFSGIISLARKDKERGDWLAGITAFLAIIISYVIIIIVIATFTWTALCNFLS